MNYYYSEILGATLGGIIAGRYIFMINLHIEIYFLIFTENDKNFIVQTMILLHLCNDL